MIYIFSQIGMFGMTLVAGRASELIEFPSAATFSAWPARLGDDWLNNKKWRKLPNVLTPNPCPAPSDLALTLPKNQN